MKAMGAKTLLLICDTSFTCEDYTTYRAHPCSLSSPLRRAHPGPGPHTTVGLFLCAKDHPRSGGGPSFGKIQGSLKIKDTYHP